MSHLYIAILVILILNLLLFKFNYKIANKIDLFDLPNRKRKFHKNSTPLNGGIFYFLNLLILFFYDYHFNESIIANFFKQENEISLIYFFLIIFLLLTLGIVDDKLSLKPLSKTFLSTSLFVSFFVMNYNFQIIDLKFENYEKVIDLFEMSFIFSTVCFLVLQISFNMYDGINLQSSIYYKTILVFFLFLTSSTGLKLFCIFTIIYLIFFSVYNYKTKIFLGDNGIYVFSFIISLIIVRTYNSSDLIHVETILIMLLFPFLDMIRLFLYRLKKNKNPFEGDRHHLQHILLKKYGLIKANFILITPLICSLLLIYIFNLNSLLVLIVNISVYLFLINQKSYD